MIVFNLGNLTELSGGMYYKWRENLVKAMQQDSSESWSELGERLDEFRPDSDRKRPSEWRIVLYQIRLWTRRQKVYPKEET